MSGVEHVDVAVVGGGQAGLSASWFLARAGVDHVVLERQTAAHEWQDHRWDSFTLVTPNVQCRLPGYPYPGDDPYGFMTRAETVAYLAEYVRRTAPPLREGTRVRELRQDGDGGFVLELETPAGPSVLEAEQVVVAVGGYHEPRVPRLAERLPADVLQLHSSTYRNPDAHLAGRQVHLGVETHVLGPVDHDVLPGLWPAPRPSASSPPRRGSGWRRWRRWRPLSPSSPARCRCCRRCSATTSATGRTRRRSPTPSSGRSSRVRCPGARRWPGGTPGGRRRSSTSTSTGASPGADLREGPEICGPWGSRVDALQLETDRPHLDRLFAVVVGPDPTRSDPAQRPPGRFSSSV